VKTGFIELAGEVNQNMPHFCVEKVTRALNDQSKPIRGSSVAIFGVSYKPGVGDLRESPAVKIMQLLSELGARLCYHDNYVADLPAFGLESQSLEGALDGCDVAVIVTAHPDLDVNAILDQASSVIDLRGVTRGLAPVGSLLRL
jgi:UDP-N-acetyl-D-glucosamine dehydrogenase